MNAIDRTRSFKKGDRVYTIRRADHDGKLIWISPLLTVYSCGKQQMVLHDEHGQKFEGRLFSPTGRSEWYADEGRPQPELVVYADEDTGAIAMLMGRALLNESIASYRRIIAFREQRQADGSDPWDKPYPDYYMQGMREKLAECEAVVDITVEHRS